MRVVVAPDSFKGSASSARVAGAVAAGLRRADPTVEIDAVPLADGGEGTVEALMGVLGGATVEAAVRDPMDRPVTCAYGWVAERRLAVVEIAAASGLPLMGDRLNPHDASTYGTGELIRDALDRGAEHVILGLGGSATVDAGTGLLAALGARFLDADGRAVRGAGGYLGRIAEIDLSGLDPRLRALGMTIASDVTSPLLGPGGAVQVFGPQKGVSADDLESFEAAMARFAGLVVRAAGADFRAAAGSGAAGGIGFLLRSCLDVTFREGFALVSELADLEERIRAADLVITGEGRIDAQSLVGKVPVSVARLAQPAGVPVVAFAGSIDGDPAVFAKAGLAAVLPIVDRPMRLADAMQGGPQLVEDAATRLMTALRLGAGLAAAGRLKTL